MAAVVDKITTKLAGKIFDSFYESVRHNNVVSNDSHIVKALDSVKSMFGENEKRYEWRNKFEFTRLPSRWEWDGHGSRVSSESVSDSEKWDDLSSQSHSLTQWAMTDREWLTVSHCSLVTYLP